MSSENADEVRIAVIIPATALMMPQGCAVARPGIIDSCCAAGWVPNKKWPWRFSP